MKKLKLHWRVLIAMALGTIFALIFKEDALFVAPLGTIFMRLLKMIIVPLILFSITTGVASLGDSKTLGRMGAKTFVYYFVTSILAILVGLILTNIIQPGVGVEISGSVQSFDSSSLQKPSSLGEIIIRMIPLNPIAAMANGDMLGVIFWSIVFGFAITRLTGRPQEMMTHFFDYGFQAMMKLTHGIITLLPIGVFGLITKAVATSGFDLFKAVGLYMFTIVSGLLIHWMITLPIIFYLFTRLNPIKHLKAMAPAFMTAFSTSSSGATLPVTMDCVENEVGVSNKTTSFVLPLGATINMDGTALYQGVAAVFIAQAVGMDLTLADQFVIVATAVLASIGTAAVPGAGIIMLVIILEAINVPSEGIALILGVDRILDMIRTTTNVTGDATIACAMDSLEK